MYNVNIFQWEIDDVTVKYSLVLPQLRKNLEIVLTIGIINGQCAYCMIP